MKKAIKILFLTSFFFVFDNLQEVIADKKFCEIKYNVKGDEKTLERRLNINLNSKFVIEKYNFNCYQIGLEHDKKKNPIKGKPIFACCHNI